MQNADARMSVCIIWRSLSRIIVADFCANYYSCDRDRFGCRRADAAWAALRARNGAPSPPASAFVREADGSSAEAAGVALNSADALGGLFDVAVCGGTLGVFAAAALARRGLRVVLLERGEVRGRDGARGAARLLVRVQVEDVLRRAAPDGDLTALRVLYQ